MADQQTFRDFLDAVGASGEISFGSLGEKFVDDPRINNVLLKGYLKVLNSVGKQKSFSSWKPKVDFDSGEIDSVLENSFLLQNR